MIRIDDGDEKEKDLWEHCLNYVYIQLDLY